MRNRVVRTLAAAALLALPTLALADDRGAAAGAATGAAAGAAAGGPVGAAVGAGVGGVTGGAVTGPNRDGVTVEQRGSTTGCSTTTRQTTDTATGSSTTQRRIDC
jgi:phage tail tape-measure protein